MQIITNQFQKELKEHGNFSFPVLVSYEKLSKYESGSFLWHWHPEIELTLILEGEMIYKINNHSFHLKKDDIMFGNVNTLHAGFMYHAMDCHYVAITFDPKIIYGFQNSLICKKYVEPITQNFSLAGICLDHSMPCHTDILHQIRRLLQLDEEKATTYELEICSILQNIWKILFENIEKEHSLTVSSHEKKEYKRIKDILSFIEQNYDKKISLQDISDHIALCSSECSRIFKRYMHISLFSFLQEYRVEKSLEYLFDKNLSITEVASRAGFIDSNYYSKIFKRYKGCSPKKYREEKF
ncbi:MAG: helix-turn-helix domain-containing protein [Lachnospiraceae bacterium]